MQFQGVSFQQYNHPERRRGGPRPGQTALLLLCKAGNPASRLYTGHDVATSCPCICVPPHFSRHARAATKAERLLMLVHCIPKPSASLCRNQQELPMAPFHILPPHSAFCRRADGALCLSKATCRGPLYMPLPWIMSHLARMLADDGAAWTS